MFVRNGEPWQEHATSEKICSSLSASHRHQDVLKFEGIPKSGDISVVKMWADLRASISTRLHLGFRRRYPELLGHLSRRNRCVQKWTDQRDGLFVLTGTLAPFELSLDSLADKLRPLVLADEHVNSLRHAFIARLRMKKEIAWELCRELKKCDAL